MSLFLFYGQNTYTLNQKLQQWQNEFIKKHGEINLEIIDEQEKSVQEIITSCNTLPFLGEKRLVIVKNIIKKLEIYEQKMLADSLDHLSDTCVLIFVEEQDPDKRLSLFKKIQKRGAVEVFEQFQGYHLTSWIQKEIEKEGGKIDLNEAEYLASVSTNNLWQLSNEITKLVLYTKGERITNNHIDTMVDHHIGSSIFQLTDMIGQKKVRQAIEILHRLITNGEDPFKIFYMIVRQFRLLIQIFDYFENHKSQHIDEATIHELAKILKQHPYTIKTTASQARNFDLESLKKIYHQLLEIDKSLKTGKIESAGSDNRSFILAMEQFIIEESGTSPL